MLILPDRLPATSKRKLPCADGISCLLPATSPVKAVMETLPGNKPIFSLTLTSLYWVVEIGTASGAFSAVVTSPSTDVNVRPALDDRVLNVVGVLRLPLSATC